MIDLPDRDSPRFPPKAELFVRNSISKQLDKWVISNSDFAICGGARGADIIFAELCLMRGVTVRLLLALNDKEFIHCSVRIENTDWENRFKKLKNQCEILYQVDYFADKYTELDIFSWNNLWCIECAKNEAAIDNLYVVFVWDGKDTGDGPGGTSHFVAETKNLGTHQFIVNPIDYLKDH